MKKSIATVCMSGDLRQKMVAAATAGFTGIEIFENDLMLFHESPATVRKMAEDLNLEIIALQPFRDFECMPDNFRNKTFDRAHRKFDLMEQLGTRKLLICSNVSRHCIEDADMASRDLFELAEAASARNFYIGYEALAWGKFVKDYEQAWEIVKNANHPNLGIVLDSFHIFCRKRDLSTIGDIPGNKIALVQIADAPWLDMDVLQWSRHYRCFPGQGQFDLVSFLSKVYETGYDGYISHEIFNDEFRSAPSVDTSLDGIRSLKWQEEQLSLVPPEKSSANFASPVDLPQRPSLEGIEFIEFAVEPQGRSELLSALHQLGFTQTHQHRSKDVKLFRCGDVSIVLNEEPDSFAQSFANLHGTFVCAIAYLVGSATGMAERAKYFLYPSFYAKPERGEQVIPGIVGLGGEIVYFVQKRDDGLRFFDLDFREIASPSDSNSTAGAVLHFDHLGSSVSEPELLPTALLYRSLLGLEIQQPQDLIDPHGLVVSRTAVNKHKNIRLPFSSTRSAAASPEKFRQAHRGSGVNQIAFCTDDIFSFREKVDDAIVLKIPENYYDDLEARFDIKEDVMEKLRQQNILYDQNENGTFFHFYTVSVCGLFFEVVQRNHYSAYGEANAIVRMAAQANELRQGS